MHAVNQSRKELLAHWSCHEYPMGKGEVEREGKR